MQFFKKKPSFDPGNLESVIDACLQKNPHAQKTLIKLFFGFSKSISLRYSSNLQIAEEIVNDGFLKVFNNLHKYNNSQPFKAWIRTIMVNTSIDYYRQNRKYSNQEEDYDMEIVGDVEDLNEDAISRISSEEILDLIKQLPPSYRMVFTLYVIDGYSHREIADMLGIKEGTSKSNLQDARIKLQSMIKKVNPNLYLIHKYKVNKVNEN
ncbi:MAG: RNA polymerase sigma factor [Bacteroidota bacterium]|nr:RNA polymerase sigma factor [Bacteroidota bacterium]